MSKNQRRGSFLARLHKWLDGRLGKMTGEGGRNVLKPKMPLARRVLRHELLEERQLLAVGSGLIDLSSMAYTMPSRSHPWEYHHTQLRHCMSYTACDSALVPDHLAELETDAATFESTAPRFYEPLTWEQGVSINTPPSQTSSSSSGCIFSITAVNSSVLEHENYVDFSMTSEPFNHSDRYMSVLFESTNINKIYSIDIYTQKEADGPFLLKFINPISVSSGSIFGTSYTSHIHMTPVFIPYDPDYQHIFRVYVGNVGIPNEPDEIITLTATDVYGGTGSVSASATILEDDNWVIGSHVIDAVAFEPASVTYINNNGGHADDQGIFRIEKFPGDANCTDNTYPITVEFVFHCPPWFDTNVPDNVLGVYNSDFYVTGTGVSYNTSTGIGKAIIPAGASYVDVYIKALDDNDSDEESVFLKVTTAYSAQGLAANKPFQVGKTGLDCVIIKDVGWAVSHVEWDKNANGNDLISKWTGRSIYADMNNPNANNDFLNVDVMVAVEGLLPTNGGTVDLLCLDPLNASGTGANNYGGLVKNLPSSLTFYNNVMMRKVTVTVGINAGDNYIVKATANNGKPNNILYSEILTVWRRLWVELDQMEMPNPQNPAHGFDPQNQGNGPGQWNYTAPVQEPNDFDVLFQPPKPDITLAQSQFQRACIDIVEISQTAGNLDFIKYDEETAHVNAWDTTTPFRKNLNTDYECEEINDLCHDTRYSTSSFWCLHGIGAYKGPTQNDFDFDGIRETDVWLGRGFVGAGVFFVFYETIRDYAATANTVFWDIQNFEVRDKSDLLVGVSFHEIVHFFGFNHDYSGGIMNVNWDNKISGDAWNTLSISYIEQIQRLGYSP